MKGVLPILSIKPNLLLPNKLSNNRSSAARGFYDAPGQWPSSCVASEAPDVVYENKKAIKEVRELVAL